MYESIHNQGETTELIQKAEQFRMLKENVQWFGDYTFSNNAPYVVIINGSNISAN